MDKNKLDSIIKFKYFSFIEVKNKRLGIKPILCKQIREMSKTKNILVRTLSTLLLGFYLFVITPFEYFHHKHIECKDTAPIDEYVDNSRHYHNDNICQTENCTETNLSVTQKHCKACKHHINYSCHTSFDIVSYQPAETVSYIITIESKLLPNRYLDNNKNKGPPQLI